MHWALSSTTASSTRRASPLRDWSEGEWNAPPPLPSGLAKHALSEMVHCFHQLSLLDNLQLNDDTSTNSHEPHARSHNTREPSPLDLLPIDPTRSDFDSALSLPISHAELKALLSKVTGQIVFYLSCSNWPVVLGRIRARLGALAVTGEDIIDMAEAKVSESVAGSGGRLADLMKGWSSPCTLLQMSTHFLAFRRTCSNSLESQAACTRIHIAITPQIDLELHTIAPQSICPPNRHERLPYTVLTIPVRRW